uniref:Uncharacterized protein n=1 Tax=Ignisphaera aggregans TaxID=334771 RepID=A0A7J2TB21_9CREN
MSNEKKEKYYYKWLREHKRITLYLKKEEYEALEKLASKQNMTVRDFLVKFARSADDLHWRGFLDALKMFAENPRGFYNVVRKVYHEGDLAFFEAPCSVCGKPMLFTHRDPNWSKIKSVLLNAFRDWGHKDCIEEKERARLQHSLTHGKELEELKKYLKQSPSLK